jgi:hypothetical protein
MPNAKRRSRWHLPFCHLAFVIGHPSSAFAIGLDQVALDMKMAGPERGLEAAVADEARDVARGLTEDRRGVLDHRFAYGSGLQASRSHALIGSSRILHG